MIDLHDDDPTYFEVALKFLYTRRYDMKAIADQGDGLRAIDVNLVAEKYGIDLLPECIADDFKTSSAVRLSHKAYEDAVRHFYSSADAGSLMGKILSEHFFHNLAKSTIQSQEKCEELMQLFPCFGADIAMGLCRRAKILARESPDEFEELTDLLEGVE